MQKKSLIWLRNDLRLEDHYAFYNASQDSDRLVAYYSFDPSHYTDTPWGFRKTGDFRVQFLIETLHQLKRDLAQKNITLIIDNQPPHLGILNWVEKLEITNLYFQEEWTQEEKVEEFKLREALAPEVLVHSYFDQFLFHPEDLPFPIEDLPEVFTEFRKKCEKGCKVRGCYPEISILRENNLLEKQFPIPSLESLGYSPRETHPNSAFPFKGGSLAASDRIEHYLWKTEKLSFYKQTRNGLLGTDYSSKFSAWLANGSLSVRKLYWEVVAYEREIKKNQSTYWMIFELIWRDYFKYISLKHGDKIFHLDGIKNMEYHWYRKQSVLDDWIAGRTREPFVNANMIELKKTGWMSNRGRQNVASYFAKELLMDWRIGAAYFESQLIDYDIHSNYGNWMYVSGVGNDPRDRKFNVQLQAERYDEGGKFQRLWNQNTLFE